MPVVVRVAVCQEVVVVLVGPPGVTEHPLALLLAQDSVVLPPAVKLAGLAVKLLIVGAGTGVVLRTVMVRAPVAVLLPAASVARIAILWLPSPTLVLFHAKLALLLLLVALTAPSTSNSTLVTPTLSVATPFTATTLLTAAPAAGLVKVTVGAVVSVAATALP